MTSAWTGERAERHLRSLELFGMRFGLDRMRRMMTVLGSPQRSFRSIHVVGTNGKTSTTRMTAAILQRHGYRTGAYLSPHLVSYPERVQIEERDLGEGEFAAAVARAAWAADRVNRTLAEDDHVTQFELLTAAGFLAMAGRGVEVAAVEAGLGGRFDATNVIDSTATALSNVALEHTRWLGPTIADIAAEKLAVLSPGTALILGAGTPAEAAELARQIARERDSTLTQAPPRPRLAPSLGAAGAGTAEFQLANFALAEAAAETFLRIDGRELEPAAVHEAAAAAAAVPGRMQVLDADPLTIIDSAHNPDAAQALVRALPQLLPAGSRLVLVLGVLEDKDAASMLRTLLPASARAIFTAPESPRALPPAALQSLARQLSFTESECDPQPLRALRRARSWAAERADTAVLATGSVYLVGALLAQRERWLQARRGAAAGGAR